MTEPLADGQVWSIEQVVALSGRSARFAAGEAIAVPARWAATAASGRGLWGRYVGTSSEPYEVAIDHVEVRHRCSCPSRVQPCKHVIGLLVMWARGQIAIGSESAPVASWLARGADRPAGSPSPEQGSDGGGTGATPGCDIDGPQPEPPRDEPATSDQPGLDLDRQRNEKIERLMAGLVELDRWLEDRMRTGLADPAIARFATWDGLAARLTDAKAGALANRIRRLAGKVGTSPRWHADILAELGILHLIASAGRRVPELETDLADRVAVASGWLVRQADVVAGAPESDTWLVAGRSDTREDLIEVRRVWLYGVTTKRWSLVLSFAAYRQALDTKLAAGTTLPADLHRYPGNALRAIVGERTGDVGSGLAAAHEVALTVADACAVVGTMLAGEPWVERIPLLVRAAPTVGRGGWVLSDHTGSLPIAAATDSGADALAVTLAASAGRPVTLCVEWSPVGLVALTVFLEDRAIDVGPRADEAFVSAA